MKLSLRENAEWSGMLIPVSSVLITGSAGFVGSWTAERFARGGHQVVGIDKITDSYSPTLKRYRQRFLAEQYDIRTYNVDLNDVEALKRVMKNEAIDRVVHLAAWPGVREPLSRLMDYTRSNISGFNALISTAVELDISSFVYASSSSVYGNSSSTSSQEEAQELHPVSAYGISKMNNEQIARFIQNATGIRTLGLRFFTVYGPSGRPDMLPWRLVEAAALGTRLRINGGGKARRDFTYVSDVCDAILLASNKLESGTLPSVLNVGRGQSHSVLEAVTLIEQIVDQKLVIDWDPWDERDVESTQASTTEARRTLDWQPSVDLQAGLRSTFEWACSAEIRPLFKAWCSHGGGTAW